METSIAFYQRCIKQILNEYELLQTDQLAAELILDDERGRYLVMWLGWNGYKRIHECAIHIDIINDKIVIQWNDTEELLEESLISLGVARESIIIGTIPSVLITPLSENSQSCQKAA